MPKDAVLDACVLFSASLRDTLLWAAENKLYTLHLTNEILEETRRNLVAKGYITENQSHRLVLMIQNSFKTRFVEDYQQFIPLMPINEKDRHVLAAAVASHSQIIITHNLKDFPSYLLAQYHVEAQSPDTFLVGLLHENPQAIQEILSQQSAQLNNPPLTVSQILDRLALNVPNFARLCRQIFTS